MSKSNTTYSVLMSTLILMLVGKETASTESVWLCYYYSDTVRSRYCVQRRLSKRVCVFVCLIVVAKTNKKLIRRWDSERELSLRRHRARTTKYNSLMHKFRHRSTRLCVWTHVFTKFSEITQYNGHYVVQGHSRSPILVPIESSYTTSY